MSSLISAGDVTGIGAVATAADGVLGTLGSLLEHFIPDAEKRQEAALAIQATLLKQQGDENAGQIQIDTAEAGSTNWFIAGWRPFIGWICGLGFLWAAVLQPIVNTYLIAHYPHYTAPPIQTDVLMSTMFGMLGLGAMHSFDKYNGTTPPAQTVVTTKQIRKATPVR